MGVLANEPRDAAGYLATVRRVPIAIFRFLFIVLERASVFGIIKQLCFRNGCIDLDVQYTVEKGMTRSTSWCIENEYDLNSSRSKCKSNVRKRRSQL